MILFAEGLSNNYEIEMLARMLFPGLSLGDSVDSSLIPEEQDMIKTNVFETEEFAELSASIRINGQEFCEDKKMKIGDIKEHIRELTRMLYRCAIKSGVKELRWGTLTGVRPIKLFHNLTAQGYSEQQANEMMKEKFFISDEMATLAQQVRRTEYEINQKSDPMGFSLYISIPFCPQRCSYCSFVSQSIEKMRHLIDPYVDMLCCEISEFGEIAKNLDLKLHTVYFGGGTPTTLSPAQFTKVFEQIEKSFDLSNILEYTVEAGRPDTIDRDKLVVIKKAGVTRLSVNPQTMNDDVLNNIGRKHSSQDVVEAFKLAREIGFDNINMDLIAGLPGDTPESFEHSLKRVLELDPDNITVHSLTLKRSSTLVEEGAAAENYRRAAETEQMVDIARKLITEKGYAPYYLYRQKNTVGGLDNTGYSKPGKEGLYNVFIMDETHTIFAAGAGAVTKLKAPNCDKIERIYNFKFPAEYLSRYEILRSRKERVTKFYEDTKQL